MDYYNTFEGIIQSDQYDEKTSLSLAIACDLAYEDNESKIASIVQSWDYKFEGFRSVTKKPDIDTQCYIMSNEENIVIVFRGSESYQDWLSNFQTVYDPGPFKDTRVHEGFQDALYPSVISITNLLDEVITQEKKIWLTGHSLGGALSSLYAGMLIENKYSVYGIYTYASPRSGNGEFASKLNNRVVGPHYRVVNSGDIVPHIPPEPFYSHSGERIILKEEVRENSEDSWWNQRVEALKYFVKSTSNLLDIADNHRLSADGESYIPRLIKDFERKEKDIS